MITVAAIDESSPYFTDVKQLWRKNSATLGYMPQGGFADYAREKRIGTALNDGRCVGYLLYRVVRDRATIAHFCVAEEARRQGVARVMLDWLIDETKRLRGILLTCRTDFEEANETWRRLGFTVIQRKRGRAGDVDVWWQSHGHLDLLSDRKEPKVVLAAIDANVFIDLVERRKKETLSLLDEWMLPFVSLGYTAELLTEIQRNVDAATRKRRRQEAEQFTILECSAQGFQKSEKILRPLFPNLKTQNDKSDFRHLVRAAGAGANVFVTRDGKLLRMKDQVFNACGLSVLRPGELATQIDTLQHQGLYQRSQVAGTNQIFQSRITGIEDGLLRAIATKTEKQHEINETLNLYLAEPLRFGCYRIADRDDEVLAVFVVESISDSHRVPFLRICDKSRSASLVRAILTGLVRDAAEKKRSSLRITDQSVDASACSDLGFLSDGADQLKLIQSGWRTTAEVSRLLGDGDARTAKIKSLLPEAVQDASAATAIEHLLWPVKLSDSLLPSYIVSIQPRYAMHLFDGRLAAGTFLGADVDLALNPESVYYRSARPRVLTSPGRVLWYVSGDEDHPGSKCIRACSRIVEMVIGPPKELFRRFKRLGVYEWNDVLGKAGSIDGELMAFRFDDTELLKPIKWRDFQPVLKRHAVNTTLQSPVQIPPELFGELYALALDPS